MRKLTLFFIVLSLIFSITGCAGKANDGGATSGVKNDDQPADPIDAAGKAVVLTGNVTVIVLDGGVDITGPGAEVNGNIINITAAGSYSVSGTLPNGQIMINCDGGTVNLELAGADITNQTGPAVYLADAKMLNIILREGSVNNLTDGGDYANTELKAALFCEDSLTIKGNGTLNVTGNYKHGVASDDSLLFEGGNIRVISAVKDGFHANDDITINGGNISITASSDGIESELTVTVNSGLLNIDAFDDGIHAGTDLVINGGTVRVTRSYEGLEGKNSVSINGGNIQLKCDDDSINAGVNLVINGGYIYADCNGDGLDSNGNMTVNGGTVIVFSGDNANGPIDIGDRNATFTINGGTVIASGGNMGISVSGNSKQYPMWIWYRLSANTLVNISEKNGSEIATFSLIKSSSLIFYSSDKLSQNTTYNVSTGGSHSGSASDSIYAGGSYSSGTLLGSAAMSSKSISIGQSGGMGGWNDFGPGEGGRRPPGR